MNNDNIGALWIKEGKKGDYFTGNIEINDEKIKIVVFKNNYKSKDNQPDYRILKAKETNTEELPCTDVTEAQEDDLPF